MKWITEQQQKHQDRVDRRKRAQGKRRANYHQLGRPNIAPKSHEQALLKLERRGKIKARAVRQLETKQRDAAKVVSA